tara:strand:+ start:31 stop:465 length:435 start_codon:yes stop_codon:yes gene_type:complete
MLIFLVPTKLVLAQSIENLVFHGGYTFETFIGQKNCAIYLTIFNNSERDFKFKNVKTEIASKAEIHDVKRKNNIVKMIKLKELIVKKKNHAYFQPRGKHIMLFGLNRKLEDGDYFKIFFDIEKNITVSTEIVVLNKSLKENYLH